MVWIQSLNPLTGTLQPQSNGRWLVHWSLMGGLYISTVSVPTSYYSMWHYDCLGTIKSKTFQFGLLVYRFALIFVPKMPTQYSSWNFSASPWLLFSDPRRWPSHTSSIQRSPPENQNKELYTYIHTYIHTYSLTYLAGLHSIIRRHGRCQRCVLDDNGNNRRSPGVIDRYSLSLPGTGNVSVLGPFLLRLLY